MENTYMKECSECKQVVNHLFEKCSLCDNEMNFLMTSSGISSELENFNQNLINYKE